MKVFTIGYMKVKASLVDCIKNYGENKKSDNADLPVKSRLKQRLKKENQFRKDWILQQKEKKSSIGKLTV